MLFDDTFRIGGGGSMHADCEMILCGPDHDTGLDACELPEEHELSLEPLPGNDWRPAGPVGDRSGELAIEPLPGSPEALLAAAREWLVECFPDQEDEIIEADDRTIRQNVDRFWDGGWPSFRHCNG